MTPTIVADHPVEARPHCHHYSVERNIRRAAKGDSLLMNVQDVEVCGDVEPQYASIGRSLPILQVHVQRVQFDPIKKSSFKSNNHLELEETIYMDRYMESDDPDLLERRQECWQWKKQQATLLSRDS